MHVGVGHEYPTGGGHRIELSAIEALAGPEDRVQTPGQEGFVGVVEQAVSLAKTVDHGVEGGASAPEATIWPSAGLESHVGKLPDAAGVLVAVGFDKPW